MKSKFIGYCDSRLLVLLMFLEGLTAQPVISGESWADIGMDAILECIPGNGTILQVRWRDSSFNNDDVLNTSTIVRVVKASGDLINRDETHYGFDPNDPFYPLTIKQVTLDDEAKYWCDVYIAGFSHATKEVRIRVPPATISLTYKNTIYADSADVEVIAGDGHQFSCETLGIKPNADFTWTLQSTPLYQGLPGTATPNSGDSRLSDSLSAVTVNVPESPAVQQLTCGATNRQDGNTDTEKDTSVTLQVKVPPISSKMTLQGTNSDGTLSVDEGFMSTITCVVMGTRPSADIKWFLDGVMQSGGTVAPPSADSDELYDTTGSWSINTTRDNHKDEVMCQASTPQSQGDLPKVTAVLNVNGAPDTPSITGDAQMTENVQTSLMCAADMGFPDDWSLHWFREDTAITPNPTTMPSQSGTRFMFTSTLDFTPIREYNGHTIKCGAQKNSMSGSQATLGPIDVQFCARSVSIMACETATAGNTAVLRCVSGSGNPATTLTWSRDGTDQTNTSPRPDSDGSNGGIITTLDITTNVLTKDDNGAVFQCSASNDAVTCGVDIDVTDSCALNVQHTPEFTEASANPETPVIEGSEVILTCTADANPKPSNFIIWEMLDSSSTVLSSVYSDGTSTLALSDIQRDQAGSYRCKANNGIPISNFDVVSESVIVIVHYEVNITNKEDNEMGAKNEQDANLSCKAVGNPAPVMTWFDPNNTVINSTRTPDKYTVENTTSGGDDIYGFMVTSSLTIKRVNSEVDYGLYTCNSSNGIGQVDMLRVLLNGTRRPNRPTGVVMTDRTSSSIAVGWSAGYNGGETQWFNVSHKKTADSSETFSDRIDGEVTTYNVTGLESYTEYEIKVYAENDEGKNTNPGSIVEYTTPESPSEETGFVIKFDKGKGTVSINGLRGNGECIQLELKYEGSKDWQKCLNCIEANGVALLSDHCQQPLKRKRRTAMAVEEVRARFCQMNGNICSAPTGVNEDSSPLKDSSSVVVVVGVIGGMLVLTGIIGLVVCLMKISRNNQMTKDTDRPQLATRARRSPAVTTQCDTGVTEMTSLHSERQEKDVIYANLPTTQKAFPRHLLTISKELGHGAFGQVLLAEAKGLIEESSITVVAVKTLKDGAGSNEKKDIIQELELMRKIPNHGNVVKLLGFCIEKDPPYIIVEYLSRGNLKDLLKDSRSKGGRVYGNLHGVSKSLTSRDLMKFANDVADGMAFLSSQQCIHRDLAARNILVAEDMTCKVSDFGLARDVIETRAYERQSEGKLPLRWMALESIIDDEYTTFSDIWSYGVLLWEIVTLGARPYPSMSAKMMINELQNGYRMPKPNHCEEELYKMMLNCWKVEQDRRPTFKKIGNELHKLMNSGGECISIKAYQDIIYEVTVPDDKHERI
ncbi:uncharacterized protein [Asterias amurensis]|uniref:uncharacterized protein n=1 Tax=Asterias amurensis TaxID=7602 RepID=UPI003AB8CA4A